MKLNIFTRIFLFIFFVFVAQDSFAATKTFTGPGTFSDPTKWNLGTVPVAGDDLRINGTCTFDNAANNLAYGTLNVGFSAAGTLRWPAGGTNTINVSALSSSTAGSTINMNNGGTLQIRTSWTTTNQNFNPGNGTVVWNVTGSSSTLPAGIATYNNLTLSVGTRTVSLGVNTAITTNLNIAAGTFGVATYNITNNGTTTVSGNYFDASNAGNNIFIGLVTLNAGGTWNSTTETTIGGLVFRGGITNNGTSFDAGSATFNTNAQILSGTTEISFANAVTVTGVVVTNQGTVSMTRTAAGALTGTGTWTQGNNSILNYSSNTITVNAVSFNANANTVNYDRAGAQDIYTTTYRSLTVSGAGTKTLIGDIVVNNTFTINSGATFDPDNNDLTVNGSTSITGAGVFGDGAAAGVTTLQAVNLSGGSIDGGRNGVVNINGALTMPTGNGTIGRVALTVNGTTTVNNNRTLTLNTNNGVKMFVGAVTINTGATWISTAVTTIGNLVFRGGITNNGTSFSADVATFNTNAQAIGGSTLLNFAGTVTITGITATNTGTVTISSTGAGELRGTGTWLQGTNSLLNYAGSTITISTTSFNANANTVNYNAAGDQTILSTTYYHLTCSTSGTKSITGPVTVSHDFTINSGPTFDPVDQNMTVSGTTYIKGTYGDSNAAGTSSLQGVDLSGGTINGGAIGVITINGNLSMPTGNGIIGQMALTVNGTTNVNSSRTLTLNNNNGVKIFIGAVTVNSTATWTSTTVTTTGNLIFRGGITNSGTSFSAAGATFNTNAQALGGTTALSFSGVVTVTGITVTNNNTVNLTSTAANTLTGTGRWTQGSGSTLSIASSSFNITLKDFSTNVNTVRYNGNQAQTIHDATYYHLVLTTGAASISKTMAATPLNISGNLTLTNGAGTVTFNPAANVVNLTGALSGNGTLTITTGTLNIGGNNTQSGTFNYGTGLVNYNGSSAQTVRGTNYYNLTCSGSNTKTLGAATTINGDLNIISGSTLDVSGSNYSIDLKKNWTNDGTFNQGTGTVTLSGTAAQFLGGTPPTVFHNLTLSNVAGATLSSSQKVRGVLQLNAGTFTSNGNLTLTSDATYTGSIGSIAGGADISGNVVSQRFAPAGKTGWAIIGSPMSSALTFSDWDDDIAISCSTCPDGSAGGFISIYTYNEAAPGTFTSSASYVPMTGIANSITSAKGYYVYLGTGPVNTNDITLDLTGTVTKFNKSIPLSYTNNGSPANDGWNMIANPYPSPISWTALRAGNPNVDDAIYAWNADLNSGSGGFATYVGGVSNPLVGSGGIGNTIPMGQGFFVHATAATTLTATEGIKTAANPTFLKTDPYESQVGTVFRLFLDGSGSHDETVLHFVDNASTQFDSKFDAIKFLGKDQAMPYIASEISNALYSINGLPVLTENVSIPVRVMTHVSGMFRISPYEIENLPANTCVYLQDNFTGASHNLRTGAYTCFLYDTTSVARFSLNIFYGSNECIGEWPKVAPKAIPVAKVDVDYFIGRTESGEHFAVIDTKEQAFESLYLTCIDMTGRTVINERVAGNGSYNVQLPSNSISKGIYIVTLSDNNSFRKSQKWVNE